MVVQDGAWISPLVRAFLKPLDQGLVNYMACFYIGHERTVFFTYVKDCKKKKKKNHAPETICGLQSTSLISFLRDAVLFS